jgi:hypothetical protein
MQTLFISCDISYALLPIISHNSRLIALSFLMFSSKRVQHTLLRLKLGIRVVNKVLFTQHFVGALLKVFKSPSYYEDFQ